MNIIDETRHFFGLDIGTNSIRVAELSGNQRSGWKLQHFGYLPIDPGLLADDSPAGRHNLGGAIKALVKSANIETKHVAVGLPSGRAFATVIEVPNATPDEVKKFMKYQIDSIVPTPYGDSETSWVLLGESPNGPNKANVLVTSTTSKFAENKLDLLEDIGFNVVALEPEAIAMCRALYPYEATDARLIVDYGEQATDIVVYYNDAPRLVRSSPMGLRNLIKVAATSLDIDEAQARQFLLKFGLAQDKLEGKIFNVINTTLDSFIHELEKTITFFRDTYPNVALSGIILSNFAESIPLMKEYIEMKLSVPTEMGNPWRKVAVPPDFQSALTPIATEFAVCLGLAERNNEIGPTMKMPRLQKRLQKVGEAAANKLDQKILGGAAGGQHV
jgi:type IV pilus assembly protein PilM